MHATNVELSTGQKFCVTNYKISHNSNITSITTKIRSCWNHPGLEPGPYIEPSADKDIFTRGCGEEITLYQCNSEVKIISKIN